MRFCGDRVCQLLVGEVGLQLLRAILLLCRLPLGALGA